MITIYGRATSSNVQMVMWTIGELGLKAERLDFGHIYGGLDTPEYGAMNPHRLVPVLTDGDAAPIWESAAILRYLLGKYGSPALWPEDPAARARADMWAEWAKWTLGRTFIYGIFWAIVRTAPSQRDAAAIAKASAEVAALMGRAEAQIAEHGFLAGPDFSIADLVLGHMLYRYFEVDFERADYPALAAYYQRLTQRPAYARHVMVSYEPLRVTD